jgi:hypothetical protein
MRERVMPEKRGPRVLGLLVLGRMVRPGGLRCLKIQKRKDPGRCEPPEGQVRCQKGK